MTFKVTIEHVDADGNDRKTMFTNISGTALASVSDTWLRGLGLKHLKSYKVEREEECKHEWFLDSGYRLLFRCPKCGENVVVADSQLTALYKLNRGGDCE